ncbi:hypothetical protein EIP86_003774 [Pleurotus ostreatoroseus]|nr:hypothetical protein EIP86_003774 [Pleurotus ostreatoroseus]
MISTAGPTNNVDTGALQRSVAVASNVNALEALEAFATRGSFMDVESLPMAHVDADWVGSHPQGAWYDSGLSTSIDPRLEFPVEDQPGAIYGQSGGGAQPEYIAPYQIQLQEAGFPQGLAAFGTSLYPASPIMTGTHHASYNLSPQTADTELPVIAGPLAAAPPDALAPAQIAPPGFTNISQAGATAIYKKTEISDVACPLGGCQTEGFFQCSNHFAAKHIIEQHAQTHPELAHHLGAHIPAKVACPICSKMGRTEDFGRHFLTHASPPSNFWCPHCRCALYRRDVARFRHHLEQCGQQGALQHAH